jgi:hypothetical protein
MRTSGATGDGDGGFWHPVLVRSGKYTNTCNDVLNSALRYKLLDLLLQSLNSIAAQFDLLGFAGNY